MKSSSNTEKKPCVETTLMGLQYLAGFDKSDIENDDFECLGEDEHGNSGCCTMSITELASDAYELLDIAPTSQQQINAIKAEGAAEALEYFAKYKSWLGVCDWHTISNELRKEAARARKDADRLRKEAAL